MHIYLKKECKSCIKNEEKRTGNIGSFGSNSVSVVSGNERPYSKPPIISPAFIHVRKRFLMSLYVHGWALSRGNLYMDNILVYSVKAGQDSDA